MTAIVEPSKPWSKWWHQPVTAITPKNRTSSAPFPASAVSALPAVRALYRDESNPAVFESPPRELPELVYPSPGDPSSPSCSSSSHDHFAARAAGSRVQYSMLPTPSSLPSQAPQLTEMSPEGTSVESFAPSLRPSLTSTGARRVPNKLRKQPPPSVYLTRHSTLSFIPDEPLPATANFPYSFRPYPVQRNSSRLSFLSPPASPTTSVPSTLHYIPPAQPDSRDIFIHRSVSTPTVSTAAPRASSDWSSQGRPVSSVASHVPLITPPTTVRRGKTLPSAPSRKLIKSRPSKLSGIGSSMPFAELGSGVDLFKPLPPIHSSIEYAPPLSDGPVVSSPVMGMKELPSEPPRPPAKKRSSPFSLKRWKTHSGSSSRPSSPAPPPVPPKRTLRKNLAPAPPPKERSSVARGLAPVLPPIDLSPVARESIFGDVRLPALWIAGGMESDSFRDRSPTSPNHKGSAAELSSISPVPVVGPSSSLAWNGINSSEPHLPDRRALSDIGHTHSRSKSIDNHRNLAGVSIPGQEKKRMIFTLGDSDDEDHHGKQNGVYDLSSSPEDGVPFPARPRLQRRMARLSVSQNDEGETSYEEIRASRERRRRWTLAIAMTDDGLTDEVFVQELEKMQWGYGERDGETDHEDDLEWCGPRRDYTRRHSSLPMSQHVHEENGFAHHPTALASSPSFADPNGLPRPNESSWPSALRALLTTRDLLRTERNYLKSLQALLHSCPCELPPEYEHCLADIPENGRLNTSANGTSSSLPWPSDPPPAVMVVYLLSLIRTSSVLLKRMQDDPSVSGVCTAYIINEQELEDAFVGWCEIVGTWYADSQPENREQERSSPASRTSKKLSRARFSSTTVNSASVGSKEVLVAPSEVPAREDGLSKETAATNAPPRPVPLAVVSSPPPLEATQGSALRRSATAWRRSMPALSSLSTSPQDLITMTSIPSPTLFSNRKKAAKKHKAKILSVRELGILPVQRVTRYRLLFSDMLKHTPPSTPTRALVERAIEVAAKVADKCNSAQRNGAFRA